MDIIYRRRKSDLTLCRGITLVEILIAVAMFAVAFLPVASVLFNTTKKTHEMNYEVTAETIGKNMLEQVLKTVQFDKVGTSMTVGVGNSGSDINLDIPAATISGNTSGGVITLEGADFKFELAITDINADDIKVSYMNVQNNGTQWLPNQKKAGDDAFQDPKKCVDVVNRDSKTLIGGGGTVVLMKTIKLTISWCNKGLNDYSDARRKLVLLTRKGRILGSMN